MLRICVFLALVALGCAQVIGFGGCPKKVTVQENFDITRYMNTWYEIERMPTVYQKDQYCVSATYTLRDDGEVTVFNAGLGKSQEEISIVGNAIQPNPDTEPAKLGVRFFEEQPYGPYWVVETDYDNYTFIWSCSEVSGVAHAQSSWILSRERTLDAEIVASLKAKGRAMGINVDKMKVTKQEGCVDIVQP